MPTFDTNTFPPRGWQYRETSLNWKVPNPSLPFQMVVSQIQSIRAQNPASGLDPSYEACEMALKVFTEKRLDDKRWRVTDEESGEVATPKKIGCGGCGKKKK